MAMRNGLLLEPSHERKTASNSNAALWWPPCGKVCRCLSSRDGSTSASALSRSGSHVPTANAWTVSIGPINLAAAAELGRRPLPMSKSCPSKSIPAAPIEQLVIEQIQRLGRDPLVLEQMLTQLRQQDEARVTEWENE